MAAAQGCHVVVGAVRGAGSRASPAPRWPPPHLGPVPSAGSVLDTPDSITSAPDNIGSLYKSVRWGL